MADAIDPLAWLQQNPIRNEKEFREKKQDLQSMAKRKLEELSKASRRAEWPSDSEFDDWSIHSSELSDFNSDNDPLGSVSSITFTWADESNYFPTAEVTLKCVALVSLVVVAYCSFTSMRAVSATKQVQGVIVNTWLATATCTLAMANGACIILLFMAAYYRSRKMLMGGLIGEIASYAASVLFYCLTSFKPTSVDATLKDAACSNQSNNAPGGLSKLCPLIPNIEIALAKCVTSMLWTDVLVAICSLALLALGLWYIHELCYMEKKGFKHKRRNKRQTHNIPWGQLKIGELMQGSLPGQKAPQVDMKVEDEIAMPEENAQSASEQIPESSTERVPERTTEGHEEQQTTEALPPDMAMDEVLTDPESKKDK